MRGHSFYYGKGCEACHHTGYQGRTGIFEVMMVSGEVRSTILAGGSTDEVRQAALARRHADPARAWSWPRSPPA